MPRWRGASDDSSELDSLSEVDCLDGGGLGDDEMVMTSRLLVLGGEAGGETNSIDGVEDVNDVSDELRDWVASVAA